MGFFASQLVVKVPRWVFPGDNVERSMYRRLANEAGRVFYGVLWFVNGLCE